MFLSFRRSERRRGRRAELLRLNKEVEMRMRGEEVEEEKRKWKGIEVTSVLKMFKQQKPQKKRAPRFIATCVPAATTTRSAGMPPMP